MFSFFKRKTVASITASIAKVVKDLDAHSAQKRMAADKHYPMWCDAKQAFHEADTIGEKLRNLITP